MRHYILLLTLCMAWLPSVAMAEDEALAPESFTQVSALLRSDGIEPSAVEWSTITSMCLAFDKKKTPGRYFSCLRTKAQDQVWHAQDSAICHDESRAFNPSIFQCGIQVQTVVSEQTGIHLPVNTGEKNVINDPRAFRRHLFNRCMIDRGWRSPKRFQLGRTTL
jgi:hypothetical protein